MVKLRYIQHSNINLLLIFTKHIKMYKCKPNTKKSCFYMNTRSETFTPLLCSIMRCSKPCQSYLNVDLFKL